jgi:anti-sigma regulatory factor (Ser/Thr protein kinase)
LNPRSLCSYLELAALPTAVPCARLHARHLAWDWGLNGLSDSIQLLVSELVTNAVKAAAAQDNQAPIRLRLSSHNACLLIEVWDADPQPPARKDHGTPDPLEEGGRGLFLVAALSTRWNWYLTNEPTGKVVWCELNADPPEALSGLRLPGPGADGIQDGDNGVGGRSGSGVGRGCPDTGAVKPKSRAATGVGIDSDGGGIRPTAGFINGQNRGVAQASQPARDAPLGEPRRDRSQVLAGDVD